MEEAEDDAARLAFRLAPRELLQDSEVALGVRAPRLGALEVGGVDDDVGAREVAHLVQLGSGERGLRRPAPPDDDDLANRRALDGGDGRVGRVGRRAALRA